MWPPRLELGTFCVLDKRDNHYTKVTIIPCEKIIMHNCKYCNFTPVRNSSQACQDCLSEIKHYSISEDILELLLPSYDIVCSICIEDITCKDIYKECYTCYNMFHFNCIYNWIKINKKCPLCRHIM